MSSYFIRFSRTNNNQQNQLCTPPTYTDKAKQLNIRLTSQIQIQNTDSRLDTSPGSSYRPLLFISMSIMLIPPACIMRDIEAA